MEDYMVNSVEKGEGDRIDVENHVAAMGQMTIQQCIIQLASDEGRKTTVANVKVTAHYSFPEDIVRGVVLMLIMRTENVPMGGREPNSYIFVLRCPWNVGICQVERTSEGRA